MSSRELLPAGSADGRRRQLLSFGLSSALSFRAARPNHLESDLHLRSGQGSDADRLVPRHRKAPRLDRQMSIGERFADEQKVFVTGAKSD